jgi:AraC family transcriptional regulator
MSRTQPLLINYADWPKLLPDAPLMTSFQSGWSGIQLAHFYQSSINLPEISNHEHMIIIPLGPQAFGLEMTLEGCFQTISYREEDLASGCVQIIPADLPHSLRCHSAIESVHCYLEPSSLSQIAYESVNPDRVELLATLKKSDVLIYQIGLALRSNLEADGSSSRLYADSMATALSAHLLRHYSTRNHDFRDYQDGLSKQPLKQAIEYIQAHLGENLSLREIADELGMSQYYFCRLFKRSTGVSPHQYLMQQRVEKAKYLLKQSNLTVTSVALECGFANQSHFAKYFHKCTGLNPKAFRRS